MATCPKCMKTFADGQPVCPDDGERLLPDEACRAFDEDLAPGTQVGEYRVEAKIGEGGFGRVFRAVHPVIGKHAAIKVLNREYSSNPNVVSRFVSEARAVNQIRNRHIIDIFAFGALEDGRQYLVMEFLDGVTLDAYLRDKGRLSPEDAVPLFRAIGKALDAAHAAGIAHRDLKPENIFLAMDDEGGVFPKLLDFGIAKLMGDTEVGHKTRTGAAMGTPLYMSPEQCHGTGVDHRTDIYSFGVMLHECLTGRLPFDGESMMDLMFKHAKEPPPAMSSVCPAVPAALDGPVLRMLEKVPDDRPPSLAAAMDAVAEAARGVGFSVPAPSKSTSGESIRLSGSELGSPAIERAPTVADAVTGAGRAETQNTVESEVRPTRAGGAKSLIAVAAALIVGVGITLAVTRGGSSPDPDTDVDPATVGPPTEQPAAGEGTTSEDPPAQPTTEPSGEPTSPSAAPTAAPTVSVTTAPTLPPVAPPPAPAEPRPVPPPVRPPPPPPPDVPDDIANPFE